MANNRGDARLHAIAGAIGGCISLTATFPLCVLTTRRQANQKEISQTMLGQLNDILRTEGVQALYNGWYSAMIGNAATQGVYYYFYELFNGFAMQRAQSSKIGYLDSVVVSWLSGCMTAIITNPIWIVTARLQHKHEKGQSTLSVVKNLIDEGGVFALWKGVLPALVLALNPTIQYSTAEQLQRVLLAWKKTKRPTALEMFFIGALSKLLATILTYPYIVLKTRLQVLKREQGKARTLSGMAASLKDVVKNEGYVGLYKGFSSKALQSVLTSSLLFVIKEKLVLVLILLWSKRKQ